MKRHDHTAEPTTPDDLAPIRGLSEVAKQLNRQGIRTAYGKRWTRKHVWNVEQQALTKLCRALADLQDQGQE